MNEQIGKIHRKMNSIKNQMNILKTKAIKREKKNESQKCLGQ